MSTYVDEGGFKILINSDNSKFSKLESSGDHQGLAFHIAECLLTEITVVSSKTQSKDIIADSISGFYEKSFDSIKKIDLHSV